MSGILIKGDKDRINDNETFEKGILRKVIRESWRSNSVQANADPKVSQILDEHATRMESLFGSFDYGALCMPNIISNSKRMSYKELVAYLSLLESLGVGYKHWFNSEFANIFLAGLILKSRDTNSAKRYLDSFMSRLEQRLTYYNSKTDKENQSLDALILEFEKKNSGMFRYFRKGEISLLKRMINMKTGRLKMVSKRKERYSNISLKVKGARK